MDGLTSAKKTEKLISNQGLYSNYRLYFYLRSKSMCPQHVRANRCYSDGHTNRGAQLRLTLI